MLCDPFLIKKLLKSVICGTVNSTYMHCSQLTKSTIAGWKKKKKKENVRRKRRRASQTITLLTYKFYETVPCDTYSSVQNLCVTIFGTTLTSLGQSVIALRFYLHIY